MVKITLFLDDYPWMMSNPITQNRDLSLYKNTLICINYNKSVDVGKPYIHYTAVKVMNNVSRKSLAWHPYKAAGIPGLPYNDMFIIDVNENITNERLLLLQESWILASVHSKDVKYVDCVQQYFSAGKQKRAYCPMCTVVAGFVLAWSLPSAEMLSVE